MKRILTALVALNLLALAQGQTTFSQYGISWTIAENRSVGAGNMGQFATGDYWVVGPVTLTSITPSSTVESGRTINGAMTNPTSTWWPTQGFDSALANYSASLNRARPGGNPVSGSNTLALANGTSLCLTQSRITTDEHNKLLNFAVFTVLASAPPAGSFRPPYIGTDKTVRWNLSDLDYSILSNVSNAGNYTTPTSGDFARPWMQVSSQYNTSRQFNPVNNSPDYDREQASKFSAALLALQVSNSNSTKELGYARLVQFGIDVYGAVKYGSVNGGPNIHENAIAKPAVVLAALALDDADMKTYCNGATFVPNSWSWNGSQPRFGMDVALWRVGQADVGRSVNAPGTPYTQAHVGLPEWSAEHWNDRNKDSSAWGASYRDVRYTGWVGIILGMHLTSGAKALWNNDAAFDYFDRATAIYFTAPNASYGAADPTPGHVKAMWVAHRNAAPVGQTAVPVASPGGVAFQSPVSVTLSCTTPSATIQYRTRTSTDGGATWSAWSSYGAYSTPLNFSVTTQLDAYATASGLTQSANMATQTYTQGPYNVGFAFEGAELDDPQTEDFSIEWEMTPTAASMDMVVGISQGISQNYNGYAAIVRFNSSGIIDASDGTPSGYDAENVLNWVNGTTVTVDMQVDFDARTYTAVVTPSGGSPTIIALDYPFRATPTAITHLSWRALVGSGTVDDITLGAAQVPAAAPTWGSSQPGNHSTAQNITITTNESGGTTRYTATTNGSAPAEVTESSTTYTGAIAAGAGLTTRVRARTFKSGFQRSAPLDGTWVVDAVVVPPTPLEAVLVDNVGGEYAGPTVAVTPQNIHVAATAYYTLNGATPTTGSTEYTSGAITVTPPQTLKIFQTADGYTDSPVSTYNYTLTGTEPDPDDIPVSDPEHVTTVVLPRTYPNRSQFIVDVSFPNTSVRGFLGAGSHSVILETDMDMGWRIDDDGEIEAIDGTVFDAENVVAIEVGTTRFRFKRNPTNYSLWVQRPSDGSAWVQIAANYSFGAQGSIDRMVAKASAQSFTIESIDSKEAKVLISP